MEKSVYTVSRLNQDAHSLLEKSFGLIQVEGEISNFVRASSGHIYLSLKDSRSQLRSAMFKGRNRYLDFEPENGQQVVVRGKLSIYQARGDYQLIAEHMEMAGRGLLHKRFQESVERLRREGWFDQERKRSLPLHPRTIGVITSPTGAAIRDVLIVLKRRYPVADVIVYPTQVQGNTAAGQIVAAINRAAMHARADVLLVTRGGGSLEDLWSFNEEAVAAAIMQSPIPVVAGIGHEVDVTIADMVADLRAPTPSAAAEMLVPDIADDKQRIQQLLIALLQRFSQRTRERQAMLQQVSNRLLAQHPRRVIVNRQQRGDEIDMRLRRAMRQTLQHREMKLQQLRARLLKQTPQTQLDRNRAKISQFTLRLESSMKTRLATSDSRWRNLTRALDAVSPLATLSRGYAIVRKQDERVVTEASQVNPGDEIETILAEGRLQSTVKRVIGN